MKLRDLEAQFVRVIDHKTFAPVSSIAEAHGVKFLCPTCFAQNGGKVGTHSVICWSRSAGTPDDMPPLPGRWTLCGTSIDDLTLNGDPPDNARSVALPDGCRWHDFITNGEAGLSCDAPPPIQPATIQPNEDKKMSDLSRAARNDHSGLLLALIALFKNYVLMRLNGGHSPADAAQMIADVTQLHNDAQDFHAAQQAQQAAVVAPADHAGE